MTRPSHLRWSVGSWFGNWFKTDCQNAGADPAERFPLRSWRRWIDFDHTIWLLFLGFWFIEPAAGHQPLSKWLWLCLVIALFIPFWLLAHRGELNEDPVTLAIRDPVSYGVALASVAVIAASIIQVKWW